jgi:hypothetical protein
MRGRVWCVLAVVPWLVATGSARKKKPREVEGFVYVQRLGAAEVLQQGQVCLTLPNPKLKPGDPVAVIATDGGVEQAQVTAKLDKSCARHPDTEPGDAFYTLQLAKNRLQAGTLGLGIANYSGPFENTRGFVGFNTLRLQGKPDYFSSCAGGEGVNLLVWNGLPRQGTLEWHRYYYLGYDVEATCTDADTAAIKQLEK